MSTWAAFCIKPVLSTNVFVAAVCNMLKQFLFDCLHVCLFFKQFNLACVLASDLERPTLADVAHLV